MSDLEAINRLSEEERRARRKARIEQMRREKEKQERFWKTLKIGIPTLLVLGVILFAFQQIVGFRLSAAQEEKRQKEQAEQQAKQQEMEELRLQPDAAGFDVISGEDFSTDERAPLLAEGQAESALLADSAAQEEQAGEGEESLLGGDGSSTQLSPFMEGYTSSSDALKGHTTEKTTGFSTEVLSQYGVLMDAETGEIKAMRKADERMYPASMTKVLTILVAAENLPDPDLEKKVPITIEVTDFSYRNDCSAVGFSVDEEATVRDLFYGTILPSGGDAAYALAQYVAGSMENFTDLMNEKLRQLGLSSSAHFTNPVGLFDEDHYCTIYDMAIIMDAAMRNEFCKEVLSAHTYTTSKTPQHPDGITISNWFLRRIEDKDSGGLVVGAKTGYVVQSRNCAVSYATDAEGHPYICATGMAPGGWKCIYDHVRVYKAFFSEGGFAPESIGDAPAAEDEGGEDE